MGQSGPGRFMQDFLGLSGVEPVRRDASATTRSSKWGRRSPRCRPSTCPPTPRCTEFFGAFVPDADAGDTDALQSEDYGEAVGWWRTG